MLYLEIDVGKKHHMASMLGEGVKKPLSKGFSFDNSTEGAESLVAKISEFAHDDGDSGPPSVVGLTNLLSITPAFRKLLIRWRIGALLIFSLSRQISLS